MVRGEPTGTVRRRRGGGHRHGGGENSPSNVRDGGVRPPVTRWQRHSPVRSPSHMRIQLNQSISKLESIEECGQRWRRVQRIYEVRLGCRRARGARRFAGVPTGRRRTTELLMPTLRKGDFVDRSRLIRVYRSVGGGPIQSLTPGFALDVK